MPRCHNCERLALCLVGPDEETAVPMCLDCWVKFNQANNEQIAMLERQYNLLLGQAEAVVGIPSGLPRFPDRQPVRIEGMTFNNISVSNSTVGAINTGSVAEIDASVTALRQGPDAAGAQALLNLTQRILNDVDTDGELKRKLIDILGVLANEAASPKEKRHSAVIEPLLTEMATLASGAAGLAQLWAQYGPAIIQLLR